MPHTPFPKLTNSEGILTNGGTRCVLVGGSEGRVLAAWHFPSLVILLRRGRGLHKLLPQHLPSTSSPTGFTSLSLNLEVLMFLFAFRFIYMAVQLLRTEMPSSGVCTA